jgi:hypothetical protein
MSRWTLLTKEQRKAANAKSTAKNRRYHLPAIAAKGAAASRAWYFAQPPEIRALVVSRLVAAWMRSAAIRRGHTTPIIYEREVDVHNDEGTLTIDIDQLEPEAPPDPRLYRALEGGGYVSREFEAEWNRPIDPEAADAAERRARRRKRRAARKRRRAEPVPTVVIVEDPDDVGGSGGGSGGG